MKKLCYFLTQTSPQKRAVTFDSVDRSAQNFKGPLNSVPVIFVQVTQTPGALGVRPGPRKRGFLPKLSPPGVLGRVTPFRNWDDEAKNVGSAILIFCPQPEKTGPEGGAGQGGNQNFGFQTFFIKGIPP